MDTVFFYIYSPVGHEYLLHGSEDDCKKVLELLSAYQLAVFEKDDYPASVCVIGYIRYEQAPTHAWGLTLVDCQGKSQQAFDLLLESFFIPF